MAKRTAPEEDSATRTALIDATEQLLQEEGYAALTSRRIGARAGVKSPLIHYYFESLDDLYLAVFRRTAQEALRRIDEALRSERPARAVWEIMSDPGGARFTMELTALALHRASISHELATFSGMVRDRVAQGFERRFQARGIASPLPAVVAQMLMVAVAAFLTQEKAIGISKEHAKLEAAVETWLEFLDGCEGVASASE